MGRPNRTTILIACTVAFFATFYARMAISPVIPFISADFEVSNTAIGFALTGMWLVYGLTQYPSGILGDRYGEKLIVLVAVGGTVVATILLAVSPVFGAFVVFVVLLGAVAGLHYSPATTLLARTHDDVGRAIGIHLGGSPAAGLIAPIIAAWVGVRFGWRIALATTVLVGVPAYVLVRWGVPSMAPQHPSESIRHRLREGAAGDVLTRPAILLTLVIAMLGTFVIQGLMSFLPTFFFEYHELSATLGGIAFSAFFVLRAIAQFGLGTVSDTYSREFAIGGAMAVGTVGLVLLVVAPGPLSLALGVALLGTGMGFLAVVDPRFLDAMGEAEQGAGFGLVRTAYLVVGSAGSLGVGALADLFGWAVAMFALAGLLAFVLALILVNWALDLGY